MPEHFHVLLTPLSLPLERAAMYVKGGSARTIGEKLNSKFPVWQRGFSDHRIRDFADYMTHMEYIHQNPVDRRLADTPDEYPWSSGSGRYVIDDAPQGLKPLTKPSLLGTAEAVP